MVLFDATAVPGSRPDRTVPSARVPASSRRRPARGRGRSREPDLHMDVLVLHCRWRGPASGELAVRGATLVMNRTRYGYRRRLGHEHHGNRPGRTRSGPVRSATTLRTGAVGEYPAELCCQHPRVGGAVRPGPGAGLVRRAADGRRRMRRPDALARAPRNRSSFSPLPPSPAWFLFFPVRAVLARVALVDIAGGGRCGPRSSDLGAAKAPAQADADCSGTESSGGGAGGGGKRRSSRACMAKMRSISATGMSRKSRITWPPRGVVISLWRVRGTNAFSMRPDG